jgi:hypothetical protein
MKEIRSDPVNLYVDILRYLIDFDWIISHLISDRNDLDQINLIFSKNK